MERCVGKLRDAQDGWEPWEVRREAGTGRPSGPPGGASPAKALTAEFPACRTVRGSTSAALSHPTYGTSLRQPLPSDTSASSLPT